MEDPNIIIQFASDTTEDGYLILEQEDYPEEDTLTMLDVVRLLSSVIGVDNATSYVSDCLMSGNGTRFTTTVLAYPYPSDLDYNFGVTSGSASQSGLKLVTKTETLKFSSDNVVSFKYPLHTFIRGKWLTGVYDSDGTVLPTPQVTRVGQNIRLDLHVWGSYEVTYTTLERSHLVSIVARVGATENFFQSVFYASFDYGVELLNLDPPPNAEENYVNGVDCNGYATDGSGDGSTTIIDDDDPTSIPVATPVNETIVFDYCRDW